MADRTSIEWTDATVNAVNGCSVLSPGCKRCYAMRLAGTRMKTHPTREGLTVDTKAGPVWNGVVRLHEPALLQPLSWKRPRKIFWNAHGDLFHENVPDEWIDRVFAVCALTPQHAHQILTKRSERMREYMTHHLTGFRIRSEMQAIQKQAIIEMTWPLPNVWLGVSVEDQTRADERIPDLLWTPAAVWFVSVEPLLGPVDLTNVKAPRWPDEPEDSLDIDWRFDALATGDYYWFDGEHGQPGDCSDGPYRDARIDWVIVGGESGPGSRPMHPDWVRTIRDQCAGAEDRGDTAPVPFLFKQWGDWYEVDNFDGSIGTVEVDNASDIADLLWDRAQCPVLIAQDGRLYDRATLPDDLACRLIDRVGKKAAGRLLDGVQHDGMPAHG